jgi:hypothetical protein
MATKRKTRSTVEIPPATIESSTTVTRAKLRQIAPKIISEPETNPTKPKKEETKKALIVIYEETNRSIEKKPRKTVKAKDKEEEKVPEPVKILSITTIPPQIEETKKSEEKKPRKLGKKEPKIHKCYICDKVFRGLNDLRKHLRIHSDERPYQCQHCMKKFRQGGCLKNHIASQHGTDVVFICDLCSKQ